MIQILLGLLLQLSLCSLAAAAPITTQNNSWQAGTGGGIIGFIIFVLDIIVFVEVLKSSRPASHKVLWCLVVFLFPVVGLILYYLFSNREQHNNGSGYEAISG